MFEAGYLEITTLSELEIYLMLSKSTSILCWSSNFCAMSESLNLSFEFEKRALFKFDPNEVVKLFFPANLSEWHQTLASAAINICESMHNLHFHSCPDFKEKRGPESIKLFPTCNFVNYSKFMRIIL